MLSILQGKKLKIAYNNQVQLMKQTNKSQQRGKNVKIYDKIRITHQTTGLRLHAQEKQLKNGSYNQGIGCHKALDETDWFVVLKADSQPSKSRTNLSYHFQYADKILLSNVAFKKYLHSSSEFQSEISKNYEASLCDNGDGSVACLEDQWIVSKASNSQDNYWRVGQQIILQSVLYDKPLCSHRRKLKQTGDNQVFVLRQFPKPPEPVQSEKSNKKQPNVQKKQVYKDSIWIVSQIEPFIYSSNLTDKKQAKTTIEIEEINKLKQIKKQMPKKQNNLNESTSQLLKFGNQRIRQIEDQRKKIEEQQKKKSCWKKYFCCCCPDDSDHYSSLH